MRGSVRGVDQILENVPKIHVDVDRCVDPRFGSDVWKALRKCKGNIVGLASNPSNLRQIFVSHQSIRGMDQMRGKGIENSRKTKL